MDEDVKLTVVADAKQVPGELRENVEKPFDQAGTVAEIMGKKATGALGGVQAEATKIGGLKFGESFAGQASTAAAGAGGFSAKTAELVGTLGKYLGVIGASYATFNVFYDGTRKVIETLKDLGVDLDKGTGGFFEMATGVQEAEAALGEFATAADAANRAIEAIKGARDKFVQGLEKQRQALRSASEAIQQQVKDEQAHGQVQKATLEWIEKTLDGYDRLGDKAPEGLLKLASALGVLSTAQKEAAEEAEKASEKKVAAAAAEEEAARKVAAAEQERARVEIEAAKARQKAAEEAAAAKVKAANEEVAAAQAAVKAEEEIYGSRPDTNSAEGVSRLKQELSELDDIQQRAALSAEQLARKFDLEEQIRAAEVQRRSAAERQRALDAEEAAYQKLKAARDAMAAAEERALQASIDQLRLKEKQQLQTEQLTGSTTAMAEAAFKASMGIEDLGDALGAAGGPAGDMAGTTEEIAKALDEGKDSVEEMKEKVKDLQTEGLNPLLAQAREFLKIAPAIEAAFARISAAAAAIRMGG